MCINSRDFGQVIYVAVGATMVGSIAITRKAGEEIKKGEEMGYFAFGGSTILTIFQPGKVIFDEDIILNSSKPIETLMKMGESIGTVAQN